MESKEASKEAMAEDDQPPTEAVAESRKRPHERTSPLRMPDGGNVGEGSVTSTPRKRKRRGRRAKHDKQEVIDFLPSGASFNQVYIPAEESQGDMQLEMESKRNVELLDDAAHSVVGRDEELRKDVRSGVPTHPEMRIGGQDVSTRLALARLEGFVQRLSSLSPHNNHPEFGFAQKEVHNAEVDYNYCLYYPVDKAWRPPPSADKRDTAKAKSLNKPKHWRSALWHLIEKSMKSERLEQVRDGSLVAAEIPFDISDSVKSISHEAKKQEDGDKDDLHEVKLFRSTEPSLTSVSRSPEHMMINVSDGTAKEAEGQGDEARLELKVRQESSASHVDKIVRTIPLNYVSLSSGSEEGEVDESPPQSEAGDAMLDYLSSNGLKREPPGPPQYNGPSEILGNGTFLKDLSPEALNKQLRYFHVGKLPEDVDFRLPVKCLACGEAGHDSYNCEALKCSNCGAYNKHVTVRCPTNPRCSKCREKGHSKSSCPYKLKQISLDEITCDLCQLSGHIEEDCELMWRTSGGPWKPALLSTTGFLLSCYECGNPGHLGNDCHTRRPGKGCGSSTWSMFGKFDAPLRSEQYDIQVSTRPKRHSRGKKAAEMKIKGRALNGPPTHTPEVLPDRSNFLHPRRVPEPARKGKIQINASTSQRLNEAPPSAQFVGINQPFGTYGSVQQPQYPDYRNLNDPAHGEEAGLAHYNHGNPMYDGNYGGARRRSRSPPRNSRNRDYRNDRYQSGPLPPQRGYRNDNLYRPMSSAAQKAYSKRRI